MVVKKKRSFSLGQCASRDGHFAVFVHYIKLVSKPSAHGCFPMMTGRTEVQGLGFSYHVQEETLTLGKHTTAHTHTVPQWFLYVTTSCSRVFMYE